MFKNRFLTILVAVALLAIMAFTIQGVIATKSVVSQVEAASRQLYASNPELSVAARYKAERNSPVKSNRFAANPELSIVHRYSGDTSAVHTSLALNPELSVAKRYAASHSQISESSFLSINPELSLARRYAAMRAGK